MLTLLEISLAACVIIFVLAAVKLQIGSKRLFKKGDKGEAFEYGGFAVLLYFGAAVILVMLVYPYVIRFL